MGAFKYQKEPSTKAQHEGAVLHLLDLHSSEVMFAPSSRLVGIDREDVPAEQGLLLAEEQNSSLPDRFWDVRHLFGMTAALLLFAGAASVTRHRQSPFKASPEKHVWLQQYDGAPVAGYYPASAYPTPSPEFAGVGAAPAPVPTVITDPSVPVTPVAAPVDPPLPAAAAPADATPAVAPIPPAEPGTCSAPGDDCRGTKCCDAEKGGAGMTCFEKDANWASCQDHCDSEKWSCNKLGPRTKVSAGCAWAGDDCADTKLCCNSGFMCVKKDADFTGCTQTEKKTTWVTQQVPIPDGWDGAIVGPGRNEYEVGPAEGGADVSGTELYCFLAFLPGSEEEGLVNFARENKASVFACDDSDVFHTWDSGSTSWDSGESTVTNTDVFINVWEQVGKSGKYLAHDWTAKVDPDAVLLPDRLKAHLAGLSAPAYRPIYIKNNVMDKGMGNNGFLGAVEVFSKQAVMVYLDNAEGCHKSLGTAAGEDGYIKSCMDALGVGFMTDGELFFPDKSAGACNLEQRAAFHPLKTVTDWKCCFDITNGKPHTVEYGECKDP